MKSGAILLLLITCIPQISLSQKLQFRSLLHLTSKEQTRIHADSVYRYQFSAVDSSNRPFSYSIKSLPSWLHYNAATHSLYGKPVKPGQYPVHVIASNEDTSVLQRFMLTVYNDKTTDILCLGNSITNGTGIFNSYRRALWQMLRKNNYNFDLVGSWSSHHMGGAMPNPDFDLDHEGHSGWTASDVLNPPGWDKQRGNIDQWLQIYSPDIVLMELGTNEVFQCVPITDALKNISAIIDKLQKNNSGVKIFLAQIPPLGEQWGPKKLCGNDTAYAQRVIVFNRELKDFAVKKNTAASLVKIVDQYAGINPAKDLYDDIHPNERGEKIMAKKWFAAIRPYLKKL